jgi:hypothetical protein
VSINPHGGYPVVLSDSVSLLPGAVLVLPQIVKMQNVYRSPLLIEEIRFEVTARLTTETPPFVANLGGSISCSLKVGRYEMTLNGQFVPVWCFGPSTQGLAEYSAQGVSGDSWVMTSYFRWRLPKPLWVHKGSAVLASFQRVAVDAIQLINPALPVTARISYAGRAIPGDVPEPQTFEVPYVSTFIDTAGASTGWSKELDLANVMQHANLRVQRFTGRIRKLFGAAPRFEYDLLTNNGLNDVRISLRDSLGYILCDNVPFNEVFDVFRREWLVNRDLDPKQKYRAKITGADSTLQPMVTIVGSRLERKE